MDENSSEDFGFWDCENGPGCIKVSVRISVQAVKQVGDFEVD